MRQITLIILHCSATREGRNFDFEACRQDHILHRGFKDIGYHYYVTRTLAQKASLVALLRELKKLYPNAIIVGHRDLTSQKACPCFDAAKEYFGL